MAVWWPKSFQNSVGNRSVIVALAVQLESKEACTYPLKSQTACRSDEENKHHFKLGSVSSRTFGTASVCPDDKLCLCHYIDPSYRHCYQIWKDRHRHSLYCQWNIT